MTTTTTKPCKKCNRAPVTIKTQGEIEKTCIYLVCPKCRKRTEAVKETYGEGNPRSPEAADVIRAQWNSMN